jgi:antibiotic biosynthesis monooxygenase (ABM) superfamily enzyme
LNNKNALPVTTILSHKVKPGNEKNFEEWSKKITAKASEHDGFQNVTIIKPTDPSNLEYVAIVQWSNYENLKKWQQSDDFKQMIKESEEFTLSTKNLHEESGMEIWFDWPSNAKRLAKPSFYKQTLIAIIVVLPLIFSVGAILRPMLAGLDLPFEIQIVINVLIIAPLITLIMPRITKLLYSWLYSTPKVK